MKKNSNRFRNNSSYNLNYRFDSVSPAGKFSGTALDLIKRYNELAKEAHTAGNYVEMEVFRQYAEHYRKIVTDINERKGSAQNQPVVENNQDDNQDKESETTTEKEAETAQEVVTQQPLSLKKKAFKIVEVKEQEDLHQDNEKPKRVYKRKTKEEAENTVAAV